MLSCYQNPKVASMHLLTLGYCGLRIFGKKPLRDYWCLIDTDRQILAWYLSNHCISCFLVDFFFKLFHMQLSCYFIPAAVEILSCRTAKGSVILVCLHVKRTCLGVVRRHSHRCRVLNSCPLVDSVTSNKWQSTGTVEGIQASQTVVVFSNFVSEMLLLSAFFYIYIYHRRGMNPA